MELKVPGSGNPEAGEEHTVATFPGPFKTPEAGRLLGLTSFPPGLLPGRKGLPQCGAQEHSEGVAILSAPAVINERAGESRRTAAGFRNLTQRVKERREQEVSASGQVPA